MAVSAITAFLPFVTSGSIFAPRRIGKANGRDNAILSIMDYDVAAGQSAKVVEGAANIAKESKTLLAVKVMEHEKALQSFLESEKLANGAGKVLRFTMNNINPLIGVTEGVKVLLADDKERAAITGGCAFGGMLLGEAAAKNFLGLAKTNYKNGKYEVTPREAIYKKIFKEEWINTVRDFCKTKTFMNKHIFKYLPKVGGGMLFAGSSIGSWYFGGKGGEYIADKVLGKSAS